MKSQVYNILPVNVRRALKKFGNDLSISRRKRRLTVAMMCERTGVSRSTWQRIEKGDPTVAVGAYAQALFVLGLGTPMGDLADQRNDELGLMLEADRLPRRIATPRDLTEQGE
jgi:transcriptional regulator with XRE-family HTH domain